MEIRNWLMAGLLLVVVPFCGYAGTGKKSAVCLGVRIPYRDGGIPGYIGSYGAETLYLCSIPEDCHSGLSGVDDRGLCSMLEAAQKGKVVQNAGICGS